MVFTSEGPRLVLQHRLDAETDLPCLVTASHLCSTAFVQIVLADERVATGVDAAALSDFAPRLVDADDRSARVQDRDRGGERGEHRAVELFASPDRSRRARPRQ